VSAQSAEHRRVAVSHCVDFGGEGAGDDFRVSLALSICPFVGREHLKFRDHFREATTCAVRRVLQAKIFEDLQESLLLIQETDVFFGPLSLAEEALAYDRQPAIAQLCPDSFIRFPIGLVLRDQHWMDDIRQNLVYARFAEEVEWSAGRSGCEREMVIPEWVRQSFDPLGDFLQSRR
jgi:hypothetical protein